MKSSIKILLLTIVLISATFNFSATVPPDEGMFPLSELPRAGLQRAGLKISEKDIYNPGQIGLVDALVQVSGCSGSFISPNGLVITNHHCAFSAVQLASTPEHNYLQNGFVAHAQEQEIEAKGLTIRITESYEDVSDKILSAVAQISDPIERIQIINRTREELARAAEQKDPTIKAEVSEMFIGKSYVLFRYKTIEDVRLVYIPRQDIGEFGGETDNWVWPRHSGDFSFLRAYVAPDGSSAKYSKDNVPYTPKKHLKVNPKGVEENDFVFILGYPGRTFRHRPYQYLEYQQQYLLPFTSALYDFQNQQMYNAGKNDKATELALATRIKRNANVMKNYRGKLKGLKNIDLVKQKQQDDEALGQFISSKPDLKARYGTLLQDIDSYYKTVSTDAEKELWFNNLYSGIKLLQVAAIINSFKDALDKYPSAQQQQKIYMLNIEKVKSQLEKVYESYNLGVDKNISAYMFDQAYNFNKKDSVNKLKDRHSISPERIAQVAQGKTDITTLVDKKKIMNDLVADNIEENLSGKLYIQNNTINTLKNKNFASTDDAQKYIEDLIDASKLNNKEALFNKVLDNLTSLQSYSDALLQLQSEFDKEMGLFGTELTRREGVLNKLMADYVAVKEIFQSKSFIPDANSTLRLTYGYIKGYSPADATYMTPFTTVKGLIEKGNSGDAEFRYPEAIKQAWLSKNFGAYYKKEIDDVPVNILYNMDTTGGNSGSPIMNAYGELIGVNFDRSYDATINDFAWNESYSRSIGVDIRYVLWIADKIDNAQFILKEMGI